MVFSGIPFLYYFLPACLLCYYLAPRGAKNAVLLAFSLLFYGWGEPKMLFMMVAAIVAFYLCGLAMDRFPAAKKGILTLSVVLAVSLLGIFKYADFFIGNLNALGLKLPLLKLALPVGISFYTFQCLSYTMDVYRGKVPAQRNLMDFAAYVAMFPQLIAGPIVRYETVAGELRQREIHRGDLFWGLRRFLLGLGKKILLADQFALLMQLYRDAAQPSLLFAWLFALSCTLNIYFDFSGYSDMAIGLGRMMGFHFLENFDYPYLSRSITEFWRRWHISLGQWFRDYVYIPLGGNRVGKGRWVCNILAVWMLTGLWHGAAWNFVLWGLMFALFLLLEKAVPKLGKLPGFLGHAYVMLVVVLSFVLFRGEGMNQLRGDFAALFGFAALPFSSPETLYYLRSFGLLFVFGILGATPGPKRLAKKLLDGRLILQALLLTLLLLICTGYLVDGSFSPFLYFRF